MANYNKSFNFRNGVQVDNDNFIVNANGLVGIGTSIPREFLDVYGTAKITGLVTTTNLVVSGISTFYNDVKVGSGITISPSTGAIRATTFYGSAAGLTGVYAIAVDGWYVNVGNISTTSKVGIGTTLPYYSLQVGQNPSTGNGFSVDGGTGNVKTTGISTANSFDGSGASLTSLNATNIASGTLNNARLPQNINITGIATAYSFSGFGTDLQGIDASNISNGTLNNARLPQNINITGIATLGIASASQLYVSGIITSFGGFIGTVTGNVVGIASTALSLSGTPNITVANVTSSNINNTGIITSSNIISGISSVGISTVSTRLYAESIGVGTNSPESDIHVRRTSTSKLQITSDSAEAIVVVGRSTTLAGSNGALRFGNTSGFQRYSSTKSLDIINYDTGNINSYLQLGSAGIDTGSFNWIYGQIIPNVPLMTLTYGGNLGIGATNPVEKLRVVGIATVTSSLYVGQNIIGDSSLTVNNNITATNGNITAGNNLAVTNTTTLNGNTTIANSSNLTVTGDLTVNGSFNFNLPPINQTTGISTFFDIRIINNLGINTSTARADLDVLDGAALVGVIGIGTTNPYCSVDFSSAGKNIDASTSFMLPPKVSSVQRVGLATVEGGVIYNTTVRRLELYLGSGRGWVGIATVT